MKTEIEQRFADESLKLEEIRERFIRRVVCWRYSTMVIWDWLEWQPCRPEADLTESPKGARYACGFDANDLPILIYHYDYETVYEPELREVPLKSVWCEEFITHQGDILDGIRLVRGKLERIVRVTFREGRVVEEESVILGFYHRTLVYYENSRMKRWRSLNNKGEAFFERDFDEHGEEVAYYRVRRDGTRFQLYQPFPKGVTVKSLKETVVNRLVEIIPQLVASAGINEPIYCVALAYDDEGNDALPPLIGIGTESERQAWRKEHGKMAKEFVWNPAEFRHYEKPHTQLSDEALEEACDHLNSKWAEGDSASQAAKFLIGAAVALNQASWPKSVPRTADFVVFAVGFEGSGLKRSLKASLSPERFAQLKKDGLL